MPVQRRLRVMRPVRVKRCAAMPFVAVILASIGHHRTDLPRLSKIMFVLHSGQNGTRGVELICAGVTVTRSESRIFVLRTHLDIQSLVQSSPMRLDIHVRHLIIGVVQCFLLFGIACRSVIPFTSPVFNGRIRRCFVVSPCACEYRMHIPVRTGGHLKRIVVLVSVCLGHYIDSSRQRARYIGSLKHFNTFNQRRRNRYVHCVMSGLRVLKRYAVE